MCYQVRMMSHWTYIIIWQRDILLACKRQLVHVINFSCGIPTLLCIAATIPAKFIAVTVAHDHREIILPVHINSDKNFPGGIQALCQWSTGNMIWASLSGSLLMKLFYNHQKFKYMCMKLWFSRRQVFSDHHMVFDSSLFVKSFCSGWI